MILIAWIVLVGMVVASPFVLFEGTTHAWLNGGNWGPVLQAWAAGSQALFIGLLFAWALSSGLFEEVGRYVGYRVFMGREEKTWSKAVMYGIGHGGAETILQNGIGQIVPVVLGFTVGPSALL